MTPNYQIQGNLPFNAGGNPYAGALSGTAGIADQYGKTYNSALALNQANYGNIMAGYQQVMGNQVGAQGAIQGGYSDLYNNVIGGIQGIGASQHQAIEDAYAQNAGQARQGLISRGLGNTTVMDSTNRGLILDKQKANVALSNQIAQTTAGYQSQLGLSGLAYGNMANMQNTGQSNQQLGFMNSVNSLYPNSGEYNSLFHAAGAKQQADADRQAMTRAAAGGRASVGAGAGVSGAGYKAGGSGPSGGFGLYGHALTPDTSAYSGGGGSGYSGPAYSGGISPGGEMPAATQFDQTSPYQAPPQYDTYDLQSQQGYNTNDPGYQGGYQGDYSNPYSQTAPDMSNFDLDAFYG